MKQELRKSEEDTPLKFRAGMIIEDIRFGGVYILLKKSKIAPAHGVEYWDNLENGVFYTDGAFIPTKFKLYKGEVVLTND